ncbi:MAG: hypothetical protein DRR06_10850 [Gammaproteobacteria bacterium]|nr:MAG: hypothetical protein DRR06_10850 [Gammaproteobacteria bacterium]RLA50748.1 MAG: hypothetical protein DRR42_12265 [Gammaproteobacteria bacterium]
MTNQLVLMGGLLFVGLFLWTFFRAGGLLEVKGILISSAVGLVLFLLAYFVSRFFYNHVPLAAFLTFQYVAPGVHILFLLGISFLTYALISLFSIPIHRIKRKIR